MLRLDSGNPADTALPQRPRGRIAALLWVAAGLGAVMFLAQLVLAAEAGETGASNEQPAPSRIGIPADLPGLGRIDTLEPLPLRRAISRIEGRISDLYKSRTAELAALDAALAPAQTAARAPAAQAEGDGERASSASDATPADPLRDERAHTDGRREIVERYAEQLAEAEARLKRLLDRQARIDPEAPDQRRLRNAGSLNTAARRPERL